MIATNVATNIFAFILVLGILIFAHESGHFFVAKLFRVRVLVFSFGFGQRLFGFKKGDTDYRVSLIPLGGYVRMAGDMPEENQPSDPAEFLSKPKWQRFLILLAGPLMNLVLAIGFLAAIDMAGTESLIIKPVIGEVSAGKPAARAGLQVGDRIVAIGGDPIDTFDDLRMAISMHAGTPLRVDYLRNGQTHTTTLTPERENSDFGPVGRAGVRPWIDAVVRRIFQGEGSVKELSGPISIARISGEMLRQGWIAVVALMSMISLQLGIMNLLPIPVLDGGHIMVLLIEGAARRDLSIRVKERIQQVGFAVLATLMIVVLYNDVITNVMRKG